MWSFISFFTLTQTLAKIYYNIFHVLIYDSIKKLVCNDIKFQSSEK